jgi:hypothetical protein
MRRDTIDADRQKFVNEIQAKQRNILWPDTFGNGWSVASFLWKGSPNAPLIQRIGAWLFGTVFLLCGVDFLDVARSLARKKDTWGLVTVVMIALGLFLIGARVFRNGFRKHKPKTGPN